MKASSVRSAAELKDLLPGAKVRLRFRKSLFGILGKEKMLPVSSYGKRFFMIGHFPYRILNHHVCEWARKNPGKFPDASDFRDWAAQINAADRLPPSITIAHTGDQITRRMHMALIGGATHEGWHRLYSGQGTLTADDIADVVTPHWVDGLPYGSRGIEHLLQEGQNFFEDIRIERIGCAEFPGSVVKMADLADFIIDQEAKGRKRDLDDPTAVSQVQVVFGTLRELGLGYSTEKTRAALAHYEKVAPKAVALVRNGPLSQLLDEIIPDVSTPEAIARAKRQVGLSARLSFQLLKILYELSILEQEPEKQKKLPGRGEESPKKDEDEDEEDEPESVETEVKIALEILAGFAGGGGSGLQDYSSALEGALAAIQAPFSFADDEENPYCPARTDQDEIRVVTGDAVVGKKHLLRLRKETANETRYLKTKLRHAFRALEAGGDLHGVRRGRTLSNRYLVDSYVSVSTGQEPGRAFVEETVRVETSIAAHIVLDESSSMSRAKEWTSKILLTLGDALHSIDAKFALSGFRGEKRFSNDFDGDIGIQYHRPPSIAIIHDMFKGFHERWPDVSWKVTNLISVGGTPMADGIELALNSLSVRKEGHRFLFVVTDGEPDWSHESVVRGQIRRAKEAGIHLIGIGLGLEAVSVRTTFSDHIWALNLSEIPPLVVAKLNDLVLAFGTRKRGTAVRQE